MDVQLDNFRIHNRRRVAPEVPLDVMLAARTLAEIKGKRGLVVGDSGESELNDVIEGLGSDPKKEKSEDPNGDPGFGSGRFKCSVCKRAFASLKAMARHRRLTHNREGSGRSQVSNPGPMGQVDGINLVVDLNFEPKDD